VLKLTEETIHSTLVPVTLLPQAVFAAPCAFSDGQEDEVRRRILFPTDRDELVPFLLHGKKLFAFHDLRLRYNPLSQVIDQTRVETHRASEMWKDAEQKRRYVTLLNRGLYKYASRRGIRYDPEHYRFYFPVVEPGKERTVTYRPLNAKSSKKRVAWEPKRKKTGEGKGFWWHVAARLRFHQMGEAQWCLSIRPERHVTKDSVTPFPPKLIGRRVTSFKARMYNDLYLKEVVFWRDHLSNGRPRFITNFGNQIAMVDVQLTTFDVKWVGIPGDETPFKNQVYEEDLFTMTEVEDAVAGEKIDWGEVEYEAEEEAYDEY
jgi:hypothetical protein